MKILWLCNIPLPFFSEALNRKAPPTGGWLSGLLEQLKANPQLELTICFPLQNIKKPLQGTVQNIHFYAFPTRKKEYPTYFESLLKLLTPDIIHIWGTEMPHTLPMIRACENHGLVDKVVINIQGLVSIYAKHYLSGLPLYLNYMWTPKELLQCRNAYFSKKHCTNRGKREIASIQSIKHVIGRTDWDKACSTQINPQVKYYHCNEILRDTFYKHHWKYSEIKKHSIFISQASYPIKGLHYVLEAMPTIVKHFPEAHIYIAGNDPTGSAGSLINKLKFTSYGLYIRWMIKKYSLAKHVTFLGPLDEKQMCQQFLNAHVFVSASTIENESNSISEAKILGMPVVASFVGGVTNRITHDFSGYLYQHDAPYMLAHWVMEIFQNPDKSIEMGRNARKQAIMTHCKEVNAKKTLEVYDIILSKAS